MKKVFAIALGALAVAVTSCSTGAKSEATDSADSTDMTATEEVKTEAPQDSLTVIFTNPDKKSELPTDSTYAQTASGLKYIMVKEGKGKSPKATDEVEVHYEGKLINGTVFDSSYDRGEATSFPLNRVIPGWTEGLQLMKEGGKAIFYIPADLAYGPQGVPGVIPPNSDLIFTVELLKVN